MNQVLLAIDPGKSGGMAVMYPGGKVVTHSMPDTEAELHIDLLAILHHAEYEKLNLQCVIERVGGFCGKGQPGSAMFTFGRGVGVIVGLLLGLGISFREVTPQAWQKLVGAGTSKGFASKTAWKRHLLDMARKRYPGTTGLTLKTADAALMLEVLKA